MSNDSFNIDEDKKLAVAVRESNLQSFSLLYDKYAPALMGMISRIINNKKLAEKTLNLTFVNAWNQISIFNASESSLFSWLLGLARKTAFEKLGSTPAKNLQYGNYVHEAAKNKNTGNLYNKEDDMIAFDLVYYKGLSCIEAAAVLNITVDELKTTIRMTIQRLKENKVAC